MVHLEVVEIVKASKATAWYADHIGEIFAVVNTGPPISAPDYWDVVGDNCNKRSIAKCDCRVVAGKHPIEHGLRAAASPAPLDGLRGQIAYRLRGALPYYEREDKDDYLYIAKGKDIDRAAEAITELVAALSAAKEGGE